MKREKCFQTEFNLFKMWAGKIAIRAKRWQQCKGGVKRVYFRFVIVSAGKHRNVLDSGRKKAKHGKAMMN